MIVFMIERVCVLVVLCAVGAGQVRRQGRERQACDDVSAFGLRFCPRNFLPCIPFFSVLKVLFLPFFTVSEILK